MLSEAVDDSRLWLPGRYQSLFVDLKQAAQSAGNLDKCHKVLSGTLDLDQSSAEKPIFRILCRKPNGKTYNEMVDGVSKQTLTTLQGSEAVLNLDALIDLRQREGASRKVQVINEQIKLFWPVCKNAFLKRTSQMINVKTFFEGDIDPVEYQQWQLTFQFDFDAEDPSGAPLKYEATCRIRSLKDFDIEIRSRRSSN
ncbi:MAG: hypothetical protein KTR17_01605 [Cellvibrionaceae bacterium]|nr:hypothetical protein [Cellvibrionaceae bacterium]